MIDLHTHSTASDGALTPRELIAAASEQGLSALALTDHDTIAGLKEAQKEADIRGIRFIPGIELEIDWFKNPAPNTPSGEFHLLGLGITDPSQDFIDGIAELTQNREKRNLEILDRALEIGIELDYQELLDLSAENFPEALNSNGLSREIAPPIPRRGTIGRPHIAALLVKRGYVRNREQAFDKYLGNGRPLYVPKRGLEFERAVRMIHQSRGIAILAHPMSLYIAWGHLPDVIKSLAEAGLDGLEAWHPAAKLRSCERLEELAKSLGILVTAGSDFHGAVRPDRKLGYAAGDLPIEDSFLRVFDSPR